MKKAVKAKRPATGTATAAGTATITVTAERDKGEMASLMEAAMSDAIQKAAKEGVTDPDKIRERMMAARQAVKQGPG